MSGKVSKKDISAGITAMLLEYTEERDSTAKNQPPISDDPANEEFPHSTTGVIRIMRAKGRPEMADLVEDLYSAEKRVVETTRRAQDLLNMLRSLHKKATGTFAKVAVPPLTTDTCNKDA